MPTYNNNLLPDVTGRDLGSAGQRWDGFFQTLDLSGDFTAANIGGVRYADQFASIDAAIADLPSGGGTIFVPAGTYAKFTISKSNVRVIGGRDALIQSAVAADNVITINAGLSNIVIDGIKVDAGGKTLDEINFAQGNCIYAVGTKASPITNLTVSNTYCTDGHNGIYYQYVNGGQIVGNNVVFSHAALAEITLDGCNAITVSHNTLTTTGAAANGVYVLTRTEHGFPDDPSNGHVIADNAISGNFAYEAINVFSGDNVISDNAIVITSAAINSSGIALGSAISQTVAATRNNSVVGNTVSLSGTGGSGNIGIGLSKQSTTLAPFDNVVSGNTIRVNLSGASGSYGILLDKCVGNIISGNRITGTAGMTNGIGISDTTSADNVVTLNVIQSSTSQGITFVGTNETITGNTIISPGASGIFLASGATGTNSTVAFNTVRNGADRGIAISSNLATNLGVYGNNSYSNAVVDVFGTNTYRDIPQAGGLTATGTGTFTALSGALNGSVGQVTPAAGTFTSVTAATTNSTTSCIVTGPHNETWTRGYATELITLSTSGATTDSVANLLPADSIIEAVVARVTTTITTATDWKLGDATIAGRFSGANATMTAGTLQVGTVHADQTGTSGPRQTAAAKLRITTTGTPGAGAIRVTVFYRTYVAPQS